MDPFDRRSENVPAAAAAVRPLGDLRLTVPARAENVALARQALAGVIDALRTPPALAADIKIAVTEAATNAVLHAYPDGDGPLELHVLVAGARLDVIVSDRGVGLDPLGAGDDTPASGFGLSLIAALSGSFAVSSSAEGTRVRMSFDSNPDEALLEPGDAASPGAGGPGPPDAGLAVDLAPGPLAAPVLGRIVALLAARGDFSIDRLSDAQLITDAIATHAAARSLDGRVTARIDRPGGGLALCVGPLVDGGARALVEATELPGLGVLLERLSDELEISSETIADGLLAEWLTVHMASAAG
jgi:anti-sigma regulatory factor (Ser/Thr protein kinase)